MDREKVRTGEACLFSDIHDEKKWSHQNIAASAPPSAVRR